MRVVGAVWMMACFFIGACGDDATPIEDGGADVGTDSATDVGADGATPMPQAPTPPAEPALPVLTPCPDGWREVPAAQGVTTCFPWPTGGRRDCATDEAHFPGEPDCAPIGTACPSGDFPEGLPAGDVILYALAGAAAGDGSITAPFGTVAAAIAAAGPGAIVAIGKGTYDEQLVVPEGVTLWGACAAETRLTSSLQASRFEAVVQIAGVDAVMRNLAVADAGLLGVLIDDEASLEISGVIIRNTVAYGLFAFGGDVQARELLIERTRPYELGTSAGTRGRGLQLGLGATVELERSVMAHNVAAGVINFGSTLRLTDVAIYDTTAEVLGTGVNGSAIATEQTASITEVRRCVLEGNHFAGMRMGGGEAVLEDVLIRDTRGQPVNGNGGHALLMELSTLTATRVWLDDNQLDGISIRDRGTGSVLTLRDSVIQETTPGTSGGFGGGIFASNVGNVAPTGPTLIDLERVLVARNVGRGINVEGAAAELRAVDLTVVETRGNDFEAGQGIGIGAFAGAFADLERTLVVQGAGVGIVVKGDLAEVSDGTTGQLRLSDARLVDVTVRDTNGLSTSGALGRGLQVQFGQVIGERVRLERNREIAIMVFAGSLDLVDVAITDTLDAECGRSCPVSSFGHAVYKGPRADVLLERFDIDGAALCGVVVDGEGVLRLREGTVRGAEIGACVLVDGYDLGRLTEEVLYSDNASNFDSPALPLPDYLTEL